LLSCKCGYNFREKEIVDAEKIRLHLQRLKDAKNWVEEVILKQRITEIQKEKRGGPSTKKGKGWSERETANLLGETHANTSIDIKLAMSLDTYPELLNCKNKSEAQRNLRAKKNDITKSGTIPSFRLEKNLQKYLVTNWEHTIFSKDWKLQSSGDMRDGKIYANEAGEIDLLAKHRKDDRWLVIELKKDKSSDQTVGQILRYMGWVKKNCAGQKGKVEGIIISSSADEHIRYALECVPDLKLRLYKIENDKIVFDEPDKAFLTSDLKKLSKTQRRNLLNELTEIVDKS
jgi:hypothetical protein